MFYEMINSVSRRIRIQKARLRDEIHGLIDRVYFKERSGVDKVKHQINFGCVVWGNDYLHSFFSYTVPSLLQDGNIPTLLRDGYDLRMLIYTHPREYQEIAKQYDSCLNLLNENMTVKIIPLDDLKKGWWRGYYWQQGANALIDQIKRCLDEDAIMFFTAPDTIFGNRSITNAVTAVEGKDVCLAATHARVSRESIKTSSVLARLKMMETTIENDELVDLAFEYGHQSLLGSFDNDDVNRTLGGVSIRNINESSYAVIFNLPSIWLANLVKSDLKFLEGPLFLWDQRWPRLLLRHNRLKVVGSSDLFFALELTHDDLNVPTIGNGLLNNDKFQTRHQRYLHHYVSNSFCTVWRGTGNVKPKIGAKE